MFYIQRKDGKNIETVDQADTLQEARYLCREYKISDMQADYYISRRACKAWRDS